MFLNFPNFLSAIRLGLAPLASWAILTGRFELALAVLVGAGISDGLDGYLARRLGETSRVGAYLDPVADKILLVSVFLSEGFVRLMPPWLVALVFGRDILILGMVGWGLLFTTIRKFPPSIWGKLSTLIQVLGAVVMLTGPEPRMARSLVFSAIAVTTVWSGLHYCWLGIERLRAGAHRRSWPLRGEREDEN